MRKNQNIEDYFVGLDANLFGITTALLLFFIGLYAFPNPKLKNLENGI
ncbi:MAG TPA: hypothetical protein VFM79_01740 [Pelobium sp.]|nr:hypothetical protein [Pelobium sp.]